MKFNQNIVMLLHHRGRGDVGHVASKATNVYSLVHYQKSLPATALDGWDFGRQNWGGGRAGPRETNILVEK